MATEPPVFTTGKTASSGSTPFFIVPAHSPSATAASGSGPRRTAVAAYHNRGNASYAQPPPRQQQQPAPPTSTVTAPAPAPIIVDATGSVSYKAPAHKHAHHLHSIPPREKTAKTLILDHMLWQHIRARFLQARSELGLPPTLTPQQQQLPWISTSPTIFTSPLRARRASGASNVSSQRDMDDEGEDVDIVTEDRLYPASPQSQASSRIGQEVEDDIRALKFGIHGIDRIKAYIEHHAEDDWYAARVDLDTARVQRATAEGMEKVLTSLLTQNFAARLDEHHHHDKDAKKSCFCHNVRIRIALSGLVNDFFARDHSAVADGSRAEDEYSEEQTFSDLDSHHAAIDRALVTQSPMSISSLVTSRSPTSPVGPAGSASSADPASSSRPPLHARSSVPPGTHRDPPLPHALHAFLPISSYTLPKIVAAPSTHSPSPLSGARAQPERRTGERRSLAPPNSIFSAVSRGEGPDLPLALGPGNGMGWLARVPAAAAASDAAALGQGGVPSGVADNTGAWHGPGQTLHVYKPTGRSRDLFNGGVSRGGEAQPQRQPQPHSHSQLGAAPPPHKENAASEISSSTSGKSTTASAVGRAACPRHLRETDECPRTCVHATHFSAPLSPSSAATTAIGAGLARAGLPLRRPSATLQSRSRSRSISRPAAPPASNSQAPARTSSLSPVVSSAILRGGAGSRKRSQSPSKNGKNAKHIQKQREGREKKQKSQAQAKANMVAAYEETPMTDVLPRFLRFSALIAKELGREARETGGQHVTDATTVASAGGAGAAPGGPGVAMAGSGCIPSETPGVSGRPSSPSTEKAYHRPPQYGKEAIIGMSTNGGAKPGAVPIHLQPSTTGDARPTRAWYALLCGIVTRAVLEGYIRGQWKGADPLEVLFGLGLGTTTKTALKEGKGHPSFNQVATNHDITRSSSSATDTAKKEKGTTKQNVTMRAGESESENEHSADLPDSSPSSLSSSDDDGEDTRMSPSYVVDPSVFEPDGMPSLEEAVSVLFDRGLVPPPHVIPTSLPPGSSIMSRLGTNGSSSSTSASAFSLPATPNATTSVTDPDWEWETSERISEFATISLNSPDLLTHLQELSRRYPPEPVERAALRFFESVVEWRGTPELEAYKTRRSQATAATTTTPLTSMIGSEQANVKVEESSGAEAPESNSAGEEERAANGSSPMPSAPILRYFHVPKELQRLTPASTSSSGGDGLSKKRGAAEDASARTTKSARSDVLMVQDDVEPSWAGPCGR